MSRSTVAITGASSFTGLWIAQAFSAAGWRVCALGSRKREQYTESAEVRLHALEDHPNVELHMGLDLVANDLAYWVETQKPALWIHHHHWVKDYRSDQYLVPLKKLIKALGKVPCKGVIYTGSYLEPGEGDSPASAQTTPEAEAKQRVWERLQAFAAAEELPLSKCVIPDPIGPYEDPDRLIPILIEKARSQERLNLLHAQTVEDHLPASVLAEVYVELARDLLKGEARIARPSGWVGPMDQWIEFICQELIRKRLYLTPPPIEKADPIQTTRRRNNPLESRAVDWSQFWDGYAQHIPDEVGR